MKNALIPLAIVLAISVPWQSVQADSALSGQTGWDANKRVAELGIAVEVELVVEVE